MKLALRLDMKGLRFRLLCFFAAPFYVWTVASLRFRVLSFDSGALRFGFEVQGLGLGLWVHMQGLHMAVP